MNVPAHFSTQARAERVIAWARLILASASLLAMWLDPSEPRQYARVVWILTVVYLAAALGLLAAVWRATLMRGRWQILMYLFDLGAASLFIVLSSGTDSPFFPYLIFALASAALRWESAGVAWTGVAVLVVFVGVFLAQLATPPPSALNTFVIRITYLVILALMLRHLSEHATHVRDVTHTLRTWQPAVSNEPDDVIRDAVRYAADVLGAPRAALVWEERDEPEVRIAWWARGEASVRREYPDAFHPLVSDRFRDADFLCRDARAERPTVVLATRDGFETVSSSATPVHAEFIARHGIRTLLTVRCGPGRLFVIDKPQPTADDLGLAQTVAHQVSSSLDQASLLRSLEDASVLEARGRVARDLHDGILQALTSITLRLQAMGRSLDQASLKRIEAIQAVISDESVRLRRFIQDLTLPSTQAMNESPALSVELDLLMHQLERDWGLRVELTAPDVSRIPSQMVRDVYFIVREALINAARHAATPTARAALAIDGDRLTITVADDGLGFPFRGRYEGGELLATHQAPKMLYGRVTSLGGRLLVESGAGGSRLDIELPLSGSGLR